MRRALSTSSLALMLAACGTAPVDPLGGGGRAITAEPVPFDADGLTPPLSVPAFDGESVTLWARSEPGTCFALASLEDAAGRAWVSARDAGPYCKRCDLRTSVAVDEALFVLPAGDDFAPAGGLTARFGRMRCDTLTPLREASQAGIELSFAPRATIPARGSVRLRFLVSEHSMLFQHADVQRELIDHLNDELAAAGLEASLAASSPLPDVPAESVFSTTDFTALTALLEQAPPPHDQTVDVVFAGCLRYDDPFFGPPTSVDGYTPRVVGGGGPASAVFMPGLRCDAPSDQPASWRLDVYAHLLAHELGHFLGLYHSVERDGTTDQLSDTSEANIMYYDPNLASASGFSASQAHLMRSHPFVREAP